MTIPTNYDPSALLDDLSPFVFGTTRLGDGSMPFEERVHVARLAMDSVPWFHTSHTYGDALNVLRAAFDQEPTHIPKLIVKIGWTNITELRYVIRQNLEPLGLESIDLGQLCLGGQLAQEFAEGGPCYAEFERIRDEGLVKRFVVEVFPWTSQAPLQALQRGYPQGIVDGYIFYLNPLQRFISNDLWELLVERNEPMVAMRTVAGGDVHKLRDVPGYAWKEYLQQRATEVAPIFERSGIATWTEFCVRFAHSFPQVRATVGATAKPENLAQFVRAAQSIQPLPADIIAEIASLQRRWSDETDIHAEPWTM